MSDTWDFWVSDDKTLEVMIFENSDGTGTVQVWNGLYLVYEFVTRDPLPNA